MWLVLCLLWNSNSIDHRVIKLTLNSTQLYGQHTAVLLRCVPEIPSLLFMLEYIGDVLQPKKANRLPYSYLLLKDPNCTTLYSLLTHSLC